MDTIDFKNSDSLNIFNFLLKESVIGLNFQDKNGWTALMWCAKNKSIYSFELLKMGANPSIKNNDGETAKDIAIANGSSSDHFDIDYQDDMGWTHLKKAVHYRQSLEDITRILNNGANPNLPNSDPPINDAIRNRRLDIIVALLNRGASLNLENMRVTPLTTAISIGDTEMIHFLVNRGANVNIKFDDDGWTPIIYAMEKEKYDIVKILLRYGALLDLKTSNNVCGYDYCKDSSKLTEIVNHFTKPCIKTA